MKRETVIVLDFGGQYNQLIARRVRECNVYCEIYSYKTDIEKIKEIQPKGIIFTGGPNSVYLQDSPTYTKEIFELGIPVLGICYGSQLMICLLYTSNASFVRIFMVDNFLITAIPLSPYGFYNLRLIWIFFNFSPQITHMYHCLLYTSRCV